MRSDTGGTPTPDLSVDPRKEAELLIGLWAGRSPDPHDTPGVLLVHFGEQEVLCAFARPERADDRETDPISELATLVPACLATGRVQRATLLVPVRLRDLSSGDVIARSCVTTWLEPASGSSTNGHRARDASWSMGAAMTRWAQDGDDVLVAPTSERVLVEDSPVGSLLFDTTRTRAPGPLRACVQAARVIGVDVIHTEEARLPEPTTAQADRARHRLRRLAADLRRRHAPTASHEVAERVRSAIPVDLPAGFVPACPF